MSLLFLVKIFFYTWRPFTITLASSAIICAGHCLILKCLVISFCLSPLPLPFFLLAAPASIMISLILQLMKATVLAEGSCFFICSL